MPPSRQLQEPCLFDHSVFHEELAPTGKNRSQPLCFRCQRMVRLILSRCKVKVTFFQWNVITGKSLRPCIGPVGMKRYGESGGCLGQSKKNVGHVAWMLKPKVPEKLPCLAEVKKRPLPSKGGWGGVQQVTAGAALPLRFPEPSHGRGVYK